MRNFKMMATKDLSSGEVLEYIGVASTNVVLLSEKGKGILLVRQYRPIFSQFTLEVPGGGLKRMSLQSRRLFVRSEKKQEYFFLMRSLYRRLDCQWERQTKL